MKLSKIERLTFIIADIKERKYPSAPAITRRIAAHSGTLSVKTVRRDIHALIDDFGAPIEYDQSAKGYHFTDGEWCLDSSRLLDIFNPGGLPESSPLGGLIDDAMRVRLAANESVPRELLTASIIATAASPVVDIELLETVTDAWRRKRRLEINYTSEGGESGRRVIEPHAIFLADGAWYVRAFCHKNHAFRTFAIHRMNAARMTDESFERDQSVADQIRSGHVFNYEVVKGVKLRCSAEKRRVIEEREWFPGQRIRGIRGGGLEISIPETQLEPLIRFVLSYAGHLTVTEPDSLRRIIAVAAGKILADHATGRYEPKT